MASTEIKKVPIPPNGVDYRGKVVLAPMVRSGELPTRLLALHYGADLVWGPETVDRAIIGTTRRYNPDTKTIEWSRKPTHGGAGKQAAAAANPEDVPENVIYRLHPELEGRRHIFQVGTSNAALAVAAARAVAADVAGIDVNAGCPKPFSTHDGMGAALLRTPDRLAGILEALVAAVVPAFGVGVSVKIRLLETPAETAALVRRLCATGITALTVHCRTTPMRPREPAVRAQLPLVAALCRDAGVACLMNGDVATRAEAAALAARYGADGAMIATAAETSCSCFRAGPAPVLPWPEVCERYLRFCLDVRNRYGNTKYLLAQMVPGKQATARGLHACKSYTQLCRALELPHLADRARAVDLGMGIDPDNAGKTKNNKSKNEPGAGAGAGKQKANHSAMAAGGQMGEARKAHKKALSDRGVQPQKEKNRPAVVEEPAEEQPVEAVAIPA
ncbi:dihydrouridine synthase [Xylariomycetidae sp. FL0641]|nr:dihydrouridine synthase [Xylariomycetidae sp. FL0641]